MESQFINSWLWWPTLCIVHTIFLHIVFNYNFALLSFEFVFSSFFYLALTINWWYIAWNEIIKIEHEIHACVCAYNDFDPISMLSIWHSSLFGCQKTHQNWARLNHLAIQFFWRWMEFNCYKKVFAFFFAQLQKYTYWTQWCVKAPIQAILWQCCFLRRGGRYQTRKLKLLYQ